MPNTPARAPTRGAAPCLAHTPELNPAAWDRAARRLLAKMLGEFAYEEIIVPEPVAREPAPTAYRLTARPDDAAAYRFRARRGARTAAGSAPDTVRASQPPHSATRCTSSATRPPPARPRRRHPRPPHPRTPTTLARRRPARRTPRSPPPTWPTSTTRSSKATRPATPGWSPTRAVSASPPPTPPAGPRRPARRTPALDRRQHRSSPATAVSHGWPPPIALYAEELDARHPRRPSPPHLARPRPRPGRLPAICPCTPGSGTRSILPLFAPAIADGVHRPARTPTTTCRLPQQSIRTFLNTQPARPAHGQAAAVDPQHPGLARPAHRTHPRRARRHRLGPGAARRRSVPARRDAG